MAPFKPTANRHCLPNSRNVRKRIQESCRSRYSGQWLSGDKPFSLRQEHLQTSRFPSGLREHRCCSCEPSCFGEDQRSAIIHFFYFRTVHFCWGSPSIRYQRCAKPQPKAKSSWWNNKENNEFTLQKICWGNSKTENQKGHNIQNRTIASKALLSPSKRRNRSVCWDPTPSGTSSDSETKLAIPLADDATEEDGERDADYLYCVVVVICPKSALEKNGYHVLNASDGSTHFVLVWRKILFVSFVRDKHCFVHSFVSLHLWFEHSATFLRVFRVNYSPPQIRNRCAPTGVHLIRGYEAFKETIVKRVFLLLMYDIYVTTVSSLIK